MFVVLLGVLNHESQTVLFKVDLQIQLTVLEETEFGCLVADEEDKMVTEWR